MNSSGEIEAGLAYPNTHKLLALKDSANTGHMIRNLSKNDTMELEEEQDMTATISCGQLQSGANKLLFTLQVGTCCDPNSRFYT